MLFDNIQPGLSRHHLIPARLTTTSKTVRVASMHERRTQAFPVTLADHGVLRSSRWHPGYAAGKRGRPSKLNRVPEHPIAQIGAERGIGDNMDAAAKQILQILLNGDEVEEAAAGLKRDQQVEIAAGMCLTAGRRAEDADVLSPLNHEPSGASKTVHYRGNTLAHPKIRPLLVECPTEP